MNNKSRATLGVFHDMYSNITENNMRSNIRRQQQRRINQRTQKLDSHSKKEKETLLKIIVNFRFHPNKGFKLRWDLIVILLSIYNAFVIPL